MVVVVVLNSTTTLVDVVIYVLVTDAVEVLSVGAVVVRNFISCQQSKFCTWKYSDVDTLISRASYT